MMTLVSYSGIRNESVGHCVIASDLLAENLCF